MPSRGRKADGEVPKFGSSELGHKHTDILRDALPVRANPPNGPVIYARSKDTTSDPANHS